MLERRMFFVTCVGNSGYPVSLKLGKSYRELPEEKAGPSMIRVVDESGEDYLYPRDMFSTEGELGGMAQDTSDIPRGTRERGR